MRRSYESDDPVFAGGFLLDRCGTIDDAEALVDDKLPVEDFDWTAVPNEDHDLVDSVLELIEPVCADRLDDQYLTVLRRLLAIAAVHPEHPLRARTQPERLAAALVWIALIGNIDPRATGRHGAESIWWWFGVTSCTRLARSMATTLGFRPDPFCGESVGWDEDKGVYFRNVDLLHSRCREWLISQREAVNAHILDQEERRRRARPVIRDGPKVEMRSVESNFAMALKIAQDSGRQMVMLGIGGTDLDPDHLFALSVPEGRRLVTAMQRAVDSVAAPVEPFEPHPR